MKTAEEKLALRKKAAKFTRDLYLYPERSSTENLVRSLIWIASCFGIYAVQSSGDPKASAGSCFILLLSFFAEFSTTLRHRDFIPRLLYSIFLHLFLLLLFFVSFLILLVSVLTPELVKLFNSLILIARWSPLLLLVCGIFLPQIELHKIFYDEEKEKAECERQERSRLESEKRAREREKAQQDREAVAQFLAQLSAPPKNQGGKEQ